jgi:hypothetical protein
MTQPPAEIISHIRCEQTRKPLSEHSCIVPVSEELDRHVVNGAAVNAIKHDHVDVITFHQNLNDSISILVFGPEALFSVVEQAAKISKLEQIFPHYEVRDDINAAVNHVSLREPKDIVAVATGHDIETSASHEVIITVFTANQIVVAAAVCDIVAIVCPDLFIASANVDDVIASIRADQIIAIAAADHVMAIAAPDCIVARLAVNLVIAAISALCNCHFRAISPPHP